ncbi:MAG: FAD-binding protein, partial [Anaerolineae bacterium]
MDEILLIGAGPAGLLAAWVARRRGARVRVMASGIGTTHVMPGWIRILGGRATPLPSPTAPTLDEQWIAAHPDHPYAVAGLEALAGGIAALREVGLATGNWKLEAGGWKLEAGGWKLEAGNQLLASSFQL